MRYEAAFYALVVIVLTGVVTGWAVRRDLKRAERNRKARRLMAKPVYVTIKADLTQFQAAMREASQAIRALGTNFRWTPPCRRCQWLIRLHLGRLAKHCLLGRRA